MRLLDVPIFLTSKSQRVEFFVFGDCHIGAKNCAEKPMRQQVREILKHAKQPDKHVRVFYGGDICDFIKPGDIKRFDMDCLADWFYEGEPCTIRERMKNVCEQQLKRASDIFKPLQPYSLGGIEGNHEQSMSHYNNQDVHQAFCNSLDMPNLTDECLMRIKFHYRPKRGQSRAAVRTMKLYAQHGNGGGRTAGAEPNHLQRLISEWEDADVVMRGHSHSFHKLPPKSVLYIPNSGDLPKELRQRYRYAANWGCWKYSHSVGPSTYESRAAYPARAMVTLKVVVWPFWHTTRNGVDIDQPKIELREYGII